MDKKIELETLINSWINMRERGCITEKGEEYLKGLQHAHDILFPTEIQG
jgi:hypothetical protein